VLPPLTKVTPRVFERGERDLGHDHGNADGDVVGRLFTGPLEEVLYAHARHDDFHGQERDGGTVISTWSKSRSAAVRNSPNLMFLFSAAFLRLALLNPNLSTLAVVHNTPIGWMDIWMQIGFLNTSSHHFFHRGDMGSMIDGIYDYQRKCL
jgi:hypothetical protein